MLTRLRFDNFRCFVDFEFRPDRLNVLTGRSGSGRSLLLYLLRSLQYVLIRMREPLRLWDAFMFDTRTAWLDRYEQTFEAEVVLGEDRYVYRIQVRQGDDECDTRLLMEELRCNGEVLFSFADGTGHLHGTGGGFTKWYSSDGERPVLQKAAMESKDPRVARFHEWWEDDLWILEPNTDPMREYTDGVSGVPTMDFDRFASWYRFSLRVDPEGVAALERELASVLDHFVGFELVDGHATGLSRRDNKRLHLVFRHASDAGRTISYGIEGLSGREQTLIQLYSVVHLAMHPERLLCIESPKVALDPVEYRRWLDRLLARASETGTQVIVLADHGELVRDVPSAVIRQFERPDGGPPFVVAAG